MKAIDVKSLIIGLSIGVCVMLVVGQFRNSVGRWKVVNTDKGQAVVIDSSTGEVNSLKDLLQKKPAVSSVQEPNASIIAIELARTAHTLDTFWKPWDSSHHQEPISLKHPWPR